MKCLQKQRDNKKKNKPFCITHTYPNMSEMIKLFGHTIRLVPDKDKLIPTATKASSHRFLLNSSTATSHDTKEPIQSNYKSSKGESIGTEVVEQANEEPGTPNVGEETTIEELGGPTTLSGNSEDPETPSADKEASSPEKINKEDPSDTSNSDEKTLKKPDKLLPCPRCNSIDTKFCYYNNYNVNQPRHFCKKCQRYWTAGGTMRNMPVGSGRRKNKSSPASHYRHIIVSEALQAARADAATGMHQPNGSMLMFRSDSTICESIASAMNLAEKSQNCVKNRFQGNEPRIQFPYGVQEIGDDNSSGSSTTVLNPNGRGLNLKDLQGSPPQVPCFPVSPWPTPWNTAQWRSSEQQPAFGPPGFPISFYPTPPYWGCPVPNPWNMQWLSPPCSSAELSAFRPGPNSQTLGKHPRDGSTLRPSNPEKVEHEETDLKIGVLTPKTLRIHDPNEAAKSSIWSTLGIKNEHTKSVDEASLHKAFRPKGVQKNHMTKASMLLQANPAALHRSRNFQEAT